MPGSHKTSSASPQQSFFSLGCKSPRYAPFVHPDEIAAVQDSCVNRERRNIITCSDEFIDEFIDEVSGLDMEDIDLFGQSLSLNPFIPVIPVEMFNRPAEEISASVVGVALNDILTKRSTSRYGYYYLPEGTSIDTNVLQKPIFYGKKVILFSFGRDIVIETLWWNRGNLDFFQTIADMGFAAVTGMNFSVFSGECPFSHALNIKKSLCYCQGLSELGVLTIPHIYAVNEFQRERWRRWLLTRPHIRLVAMNTQLQRSRGGDMGEALKTVRFILENTKAGVILQGSVNGMPPDLFVKYSNRLRVAASGPLKSSAIKKDGTPDEYISSFEKELEVDGLRGAKTASSVLTDFSIQLFETEYDSTVLSVKKIR